VIYGGIGGSLEMQALINEPLEGRVHEVPIEKVGVILLGIDGLRQDVFYREGEDDVRDPFNPPVRLDPATTPGFRDIMGGPFHNVDAHSLRLKGATAIFPSITLASWASVLSGQPPAVTGELGNEFFDRTLRPGVPERLSAPAGMVSYSGGAFPGYDVMWPSELQNGDFVPAGTPEPMATAQNQRWLDQPNHPPTIFEDLASLAGYNEHRGPPLVSASHYAKGVEQGRWITYQARGEAVVDGAARLCDLGPDALCESLTSKRIDEGFWDFLSQYLDRHAAAWREGQERFPGLLAFYQMGPDHVAHENGLGSLIFGEGYSEFLQETTGGTVLKPLRDRLVQLEEFYNKVFLITADHGHTEASAIGDRERWARGMRVGPPTLDPTNHHMHLDEFVAVMGLIGLSLPQPREFNVLGPKPRDRNPDDRDVVVAFNGPMAHVYIRAVQADGTMLSWETPACQADRDAMGNGLAAALGGVRAAFGVSPDLYTDAADRRLLLKLIDAIDFILVRKGNTYVVRKAFAHSGPWPPDTEPAEPEPDRAECAGKTVPHSTVEEFSLEDWFAAHPNDFADAANRIRGLNHPERAGDLIIVFKFRTDDLRQDRYSSGGNLPSWHGSLNRSDSYVPFIVSYPGGNTNQIEDFVEPVCESTTHCPSTLKVAPLIKQIIREQLPMDSQEMEQGP
jgi:hypothetical protein